MYAAKMSRFAAGFQRQVDGISSLLTLGLFSVPLRLFRYLRFQAYSSLIQLGLGRESLQVFPLQAPN